MEGTVQLCCKICGAGIKIPVGTVVTSSVGQCSFGCYEIYPEVISWNARTQQLKFHRAEAVTLVQRYHTYDKLVAACRRMLAHERKGKKPTAPVSPVKKEIQVTAREEGGKIHIDVVLPSNAIPTKVSRKRIPTKS
jgi:hypothetical protein